MQQFYNAIGLMSGSSLDGLDIAYVRLSNLDGRWSHEWLATECIPYSDAWTNRLRNGISLTARELPYLHAEYGHLLGQAVRRFLDGRPALPQADLIASHGHTLFHDPARGMTCQIGDGAAIAAETGIPVVSELRALDVAYGGQGAPIVPMGEQLLFAGFEYYLNLGGIANISNAGNWRGYDVCACNQVLNYISARSGMAYDAGGQLASLGNVSEPLLAALNAVPFHLQHAPKSLDNSFSVREILPLLSAGQRDSDLLCTVCEHIAMQVAAQLHDAKAGSRMMVTGGGALNTFLMSRIKDRAAACGVYVEIPDRPTIEFKEALVMALLGALRIQGGPTVIASVTGARYASSGGALWIPATSIISE